MVRFMPDVFRLWVYKSDEPMKLRRGGGTQVTRICFNYSGVAVSAQIIASTGIKCTHTSRRCKSEPLCSSRPLLRRKYIFIEVNRYMPMPDTRRRGEVGEFPPVCERTSTLQRGECECRRYDDPSSPSFPSPIPSAAPTTTALSHTHSLTLALIFWSFGLSRPFASVRVRPPTCFLRIRGFTSAAIVSLVKDDR